MSSFSVQKISYGVLIFMALGNATNAFSAGSNRLIINELKKLRSSLPLKDSGRPELTLRIADRMTDEAFIVGNLTKKADLNEALSLYRETLTSLPLTKSIKVKFQMARIYSELGEKNEAISLFKDLYIQNESTELKRESALRLAEYSEEENKNTLDSKAYYETALKYCAGTDTCSYSHYKLAWFYKNSGDILKAVSEVKEALFDSKKQIREESVRDMILFMSLDANNIMEHAAYLEDLSKKTSLQNPNKQIETLAFSALSAGNKSAALKLMNLILSREPSISLQVKYLEELYGLSINDTRENRYEEFKRGLAQFESMSNQPELVSNLKNAVEVEKTAVRLCIQLDGDRTTRKERTPEFLSFTDSTLRVFPKNKDRLKMIEGSVAAVENALSEKINRLQTALNNPQFNWSKEEKVSLIKLKVGLLEKSNSPQELLLALNELSKLEPTREIKYAIGFQNYKLKQYDLALSHFRELTEEKVSDETAILSQNLILEILNTQKNYASIQSEVDSFLKNHKSDDKSFNKEMSEMKIVSEKSAFEAAVALGETEDALKIFKLKCEQKEFLPQSCENAKTISLKIGNYIETVAILKLQYQYSNLDETNGLRLVEALEAGAYFKEAADLFSKLTKNKATFKEQLKAALFYEIANESTLFKGIYTQLLDQFKSGKLRLSESEEKAFISFVTDTKTFRESDLKSKWSKESESYLAETFYSHFGKNSSSAPLARKILLSTAVSTGNAWNEVRLDDFSDRTKIERSISFYGKNGEKKFNERVNAIKKLNEYYGTFIEGTPRVVRVQILAELTKSYDQLSSEILNSPLPDGLTEDQKSKITQSLVELSKPFLEQKSEIEKRMNEEKALVTSSKETIQTASSSAIKNNSAPIEFFQALHLNPENTNALGALKDYYHSIKNERIATYFNGRLTQTSKNNEGITK